jgi:hypothetical protein
MGLRFSFFLLSRFLSTFALPLVLLLSPQSVTALDVELSWDANSEPDVVGYRVFLSQEHESYDYERPEWSGSKTSCTIHNLDYETNYCFVVRAFDTSGNESGDSNEACAQFGITPSLPAGSDPCVDGNDCTDDVKLLYFQATGGRSMVMLAWETPAEIDTAGFNLLRSYYQDGEYGKINAVLIPAKGEPTQGATYSYMDSGVWSGVTYWYRLEDVHIAGESHLYGPIVLTTPPPRGGVSWTAAYNAEASAIGGVPVAGSRLFNSIAFFLVPIGAVLILRMRRRR